MNEDQPKKEIPIIHHDNIPSVTVLHEMLKDQKAKDGIKKILVQGKNKTFWLELWC